MQHLEEVSSILAATLGLGQRRLDAGSALLGSVPELDSMAVIGLITALEAHFGIEVADDEIHARHFATLGSLTAFVENKLLAA
jgi:acyl carrier protein